MSLKIVLSSFLFLATSVFAKDHIAIDAQITGSPQLAVPGETTVITLNTETCQVAAMGDPSIEGKPPKSYRIVLTCNEKSQDLWTLSDLKRNKEHFDDPRFKVLWAGDQDGDGKIDLKMDLSPKYSYKKEVLFLSSKAKKGKLVAISGKPKKTILD